MSARASGQTRGDESDPRTWGQQKKGWMTKTDKDGNTYYTYLDFTSTAVAGQSDMFSSGKAMDEKRRKAWRKNVAERRRKKDNVDHRAMVERMGAMKSKVSFAPEDMLPPPAAPSARSRSPSPSRLGTPDGGPRPRFGV
mmetsp:Transcript_21730/g.66877  ORF Transcript_21730/g.66877 Transcript_21730/m.66877 type:complete len:139 (+) Transcript_21730:507-923(+)